MSDIYSWHQNHWKSNGSYLDEAIGNFNDLVDNRLVPTVHCVECTRPFEWDINNKFKANVLISDV